MPRATAPEGAVVLFGRQDRELSVILSVAKDLIAPLAARQ